MEAELSLVVQRRMSSSPKELKHLHICRGQKTAYFGPAERCRSTGRAEET